MDTASGVAPDGALPRTADAAVAFFFFPASEAADGVESEGVAALGVARAAAAAEEEDGVFFGPGVSSADAGRGCADC